MKKTIKLLGIIALSVTAAAFLGSCGSNSSNDHGHTHDAGDSTHSHADGEDHDHGHSHDESKYKMLLTAVPAQVTAGQTATLSFTPKLKADEAQPVALDESHGKKIHIIAVSNDLSTFQHLHPEATDKGDYTTQATFASGGDYTLFADFKPTGGGETTDKIALKVAGTPAVAVAYTAEKLTSTVNDFTLKLEAETPWKTGEELHINGILTQNGKEIPVEELENYLGAKAHVVMISVAEKEYAHVHPETENHRIHLHAEFHHAGIYRAWLQFKYQGQVYLTDFVIDVK
jgi:hypothetical protein